MTALAKIEDYLSVNPGYAYCDDCLSEVLAIIPRQQVQQKTTQLSKKNRFWRQSGICSRCRGAKL